MGKTLKDQCVGANPTASDSGSSSRRILVAESDAIAMRLKELVGDKKLVWFAKECEVGESTLRNIIGGAMPRADILVAIANAGGVTVDWLATGRPPKTLAELRALVRQPPPAGDLVTYKLAVEVIQEWQCKEGRLIPVDKFNMAVEALIALAAGNPAQLKAQAATILRLAA